MICVIGIVALFFVNADATAIVATVIVGFALGAPFCLCMYYFGGLLVDLSGSWFLPLTVMLALSIVLVICGWKSGSGTIPAGSAKTD